MVLIVKRKLVQKEVKFDLLELTLDTLWEVAKVEDIVRFSGGGEEVRRHPAVNLHGSLTYRLRCLTYSRREVHEKPGQDLLQKIKSNLIIVST